MFRIRDFWSVWVRGGVHSSVLIDEPEFGPFMAEKVRCLSFLEGFKTSNEFEIRFWWANLGSSEFEVQPVKFDRNTNSIETYFGISSFLITQHKQLSTFLTSDAS